MRFVLLVIALGAFLSFASSLMISGPTISQQLYGLGLGGFSMLIATLALIGFAVLGRLDDLAARSRKRRALPASRAEQPSPERAQQAPLPQIRG